MANRALSREIRKGWFCSGSAAAKLSESQGSFLPCKQWPVGPDSSYSSKELVLPDSTHG